MSELRDCLQCNNYRFYLEIQLVDDKGYPLNDIPLVLLERGTEKQHQGITDPFGLIKIEGLSNRPLQLTIDAQKLADKLTAEPQGSVIHTNYASIEQYCSIENYVLSSNHIAGDFNQQLPDIVHEMSQGQIQRSSHYRNCEKGYSIFPPYNQRIVISIRSIAEPVFAKSELRGLGNTHAGTLNEPVCHFGRCNLNGLKEGEFAQAMMFPFPAPSLFPGGSGIMAGAGINAVHQSIEQDFDNISTRPIFPKFKDRESLVSTSFVMAGGLFWVSTGVFIRQLFNDDTLSYDDLLEKAENNELVPTRIRIAVNDQGIAIPYHTAKGSGKEYVPIIKGELAYEYEANEVRSLGGYQSNDGLPSEITQANIYRFITQYGITYFLGITASGKIINLSVKADDQEIRLVNPGFPIQDPDELPPPHTGTPAQDLSEFNSNSAGGYQIYDEEPTTTVTPAPPDVDFRDFIFITPIADVPAIYVYLSKEYKKKIQKYEEEFGANNIHGLRRHGAGTTLEQQKYRAQTGYTPDAKFGNVVAATRFLNYKDQWEAIEKANELYDPEINKSGKFDFNMGRIVAEGYNKEGEYFETSVVRAAFDRRTGELYSIFGVEKE
ncbi:hypothetical protein [Proteus cibi]|uniref:hypothetical protein n=1 Tax=Proteus cibi TaxID=2050966 RepID=UPI0035A696A6